MSVLIDRYTVIFKKKLSTYLKRAKMAAWIPSYAIATYISLDIGNKKSLEASTFSNLISIVRQALSTNVLSSFDKSIFRSLANLYELRH